MIDFFDFLFNEIYRDRYFILVMVLIVLYFFITGI